MSVEIQKIESCGDFIGNPMKVGDFVCAGIYSMPVLYQIVSISKRQGKQERSPYIICHLKLVGKNKNRYLADTKIRRPNSLIKVDQDYAMIYKLSS